ncbi:MAG: hypothetical protein H7838_06795 [Magnetococcus sp. DMHC-8]
MIELLRLIGMAGRTGAYRGAGAGMGVMTWLRSAERQTLLWQPGMVSTQP